MLNALCAFLFQNIDVLGSGEDSLVYPLEIRA